MRIILMTLIVASLAFPGCSFLVGSEGKPCTSDTDCDNQACVDGACTDEQTCTDECPAEGEQRCYPYGPRVDECSRNEFGCLNWIPDINCQPEEHCDPDSLGCAGGCASYCEVEGELECVEGYSAQCVTWENQCRGWQFEIDCGAEGLTCSAGRCQGDTGGCDDGLRNQDETGVDCGGSCEPCEDGMACHYDRDCASGDCTDRTCKDSGTCDDNVQNQDETDIDCGGSVCIRCANGLACERNEDCLPDSGCRSNVCTPDDESCDDEVLNQDETDVDCGGNVCTGCPADAACLVDGDCLSNDCAGNFCACQNECNQGAKTCVGSLLSTCSMYACLQWSGTQECTATETPLCVNEECVLPGSCNSAVCNVQAPMFADLRNDTAHMVREPNGDSTVTDSLRGLMWQGCPAGLSGSLCGTGTLENLPWQEAFDYCLDSTWAGFADWRLPDRFELQSIHRYGAAPVIDEELFPNTAARNYWTSSSDVADAGRAWRIRSDTGEFESREKGSIPKGYTRCVRTQGTLTPLPADRFVRSSGSQPVVTDSLTGLVWQACPPHLTGAACDQSSGAAEFWSQNDADVSYCPGLNWGQYGSGWRLPTAKELSSLVLDGRNPPIDPLLLPLAGDPNYLTADTFDGVTDRPYAVDFGDGSVVRLYELITPASVRCVHDP